MHQLSQHNTLSRLNVMNNLAQYLVDEQPMTKVIALTTLQTNTHGITPDNKQQLALLTKILCISSREEYNAAGSFFNQPGQLVSPKFTVDSIARKLTALGVVNLGSSAKALIYLCAHKSQHGAGFKELFLRHHSLTDGVKTFISDARYLGVPLASIPVKSADIDIYLRNPLNNTLTQEKNQQIRNMLSSINEIRGGNRNDVRQKIYCIAAWEDIIRAGRSDIDGMNLNPGGLSTIGIAIMNLPNSNVQLFFTAGQERFHTITGVTIGNTSKLAVMQSALFHPTLFSAAINAAIDNNKQFCLMVDGRTSAGQRILASTLGTYFPIVDTNNTATFTNNIRENRFDANHVRNNMVNIINIINTINDDDINEDIDEEHNIPLQVNHMPENDEVPNRNVDINYNIQVVAAATSLKERLVKCISDDAGNNYKLQGDWEDGEATTNFKLFIHRMPEIADMRGNLGVKKKAQKQLAEIIIAMDEYHHIREMCIMVANNFVDECGDAVHFAFLHMQLIARQLTYADQKLTTLYGNQKKISAFERVIYLANSLAEQKNLSKSERIETGLAFLKGFKDILGLEMSGMRHGPMSGITDLDMQNTEPFLVDYINNEDNIFKAMAESDIIKSNFKNEFEEIQDKYGEAMMKEDAKFDQIGDDIMREKIAFLKGEMQKQHASALRFGNLKLEISNFSNTHTLDNTNIKEAINFAMGKSNEADRKQALEFIVINQKAQVTSLAKQTAEDFGELESMGKAITLIAELKKNESLLVPNYGVVHVGDVTYNLNNPLRKEEFMNKEKAWNEEYLEAQENAEIQERHLNLLHSIENYISSN